jgi:hypothetical protein
MAGLCRLYIHGKIHDHLLFSSFRLNLKMMKVCYSILLSSISTQTIQWNLKSYAKVVNIKLICNSFYPLSGKSLSEWLPVAQWDAFLAVEWKFSP